MGIPLELRDAWRSRKKPLQVDSPHEPKLTENESTVKGTEERKIKNVPRFPRLRPDRGKSWSYLPSSKAQPAEAVIAGTKSAIIAGVVASVPVIVGCRVIPWAKAHLNYTAQTMLISAACVSGFFISADKKILEKAHANSLSKLDK